MADPRFDWQESGRAFVARFGNLSVSVRRLGGEAKGDLRWRVDNVFGNPHLGGEWHEGLSGLTTAMREAERIAIREAAALARHFIEPWPAPSPAVGSADEGKGGGHA
jgi:hypothetical protein